MERHPRRGTGNNPTTNQSLHLEKRSTWRNLCQETENSTDEIKSKNTRQSGLDETQQPDNTSLSQKILENN
eukprot:6492504-Amphidinium_carterae.1